MSQSSVPNSGRKMDWVLTHTALHQLLNWLDGGSDSGGRAYLEMRRRLVLYFDRKNCFSPDELADETLNRVARRLEEEGAIESDTPAHYCYIVARFVFLESVHRIHPYQLSNDELRATHHSSEEKQEAERRSECLSRCILKLPAEDRALIMDYYRGEQRAKIENRKAMAKKLDVTMNSLSIRASRIRNKLQACMRRCLSNGG